MEREIARLLPYILVGMFVLGALLFLLAQHQLRLRRTGAYWRLRRRAGERGGRLFLLSFLLMSGSLVLALFSGLGWLAYRNINETPSRGPEDLYGIILSPTVPLDATRAAAATAEVVVPLTPTPLLVTTAAPDTPTPLPPTPTPLPPTLTPLPPTLTFTATPDFAALLNLTPVFNTTPRPANPDALLQLTGVGDSPTAAAAAAPAGSALRAGLRRVYLFIAFDRMENGVAWSRVLYRDGLPLQGDTLLWSLGATGSSSIFFGDEAGYPAGDYEARLYLGDREVSRYPFTLTAG